MRAAGGREPLAEDRIDGVVTFAGRMLSALDEGAILVTRESGGAVAGEAIDALELRDFHALRDVAERLGVIEPEPEESRCRNCDAELDVDPRNAPREGWAEEPSEEPEPLAPPFPLGRNLRLPKGHRARTIDMKRVTVAEARPLWRAIGSGRDFQMTPSIVAALGVRALGDVTDRRLIAEALDRAPDGVLAIVETLFVLLNYGERSAWPLVCSACGALHDVPAPSRWELLPDPEAERVIYGDRAETKRRSALAKEFPDETTFEAMVERIGGEVYEARGVQNIALQVTTEVPPVDGSGEPLLGDYQPLYEADVAGYTKVEFLIRLHYRTFQRMWEEDGAYDVEAEIRETIDHEVEHHLHHLAGHDPMDEEEREEAKRELERTFGKEAVRRAELQATAGELASIAKFLVPFLIVCAVAIAIGVWLGIVPS